MFRRFGVNYAVLSMVLDVLMVLLAVTIATLTPLRAITVAPGDGVELPLWIYILLPVIWVLVFIGTSVYDPKNTYRIVDELQTLSVATLLATALCAGLFFFVFRDFPRSIFVSIIVLSYALLISWRLVARLAWRLARDPAAQRRVLVVGGGELGRQVGQMIGDYRWTGLRLVGYLVEAPTGEQSDLPILGTLNDARSIVEQELIDDMVIALPQSAYGRVNELLLEMHDLPLRMRVVPDYYTLSLYQASVEDFAGVPMINLRDPALNDVQRLVKRVFDLVIGGVVMLLITPVFAVVALAIKLDSPGPVIFRQQRVGENGRLFAMYKFRSMVVGAEKMQAQMRSLNRQGEVTYKREDDPRVTRVGRVIRRTSLDELPQLLNVLQGTMSLVGPRPELPMMIGQYQPWQHKRFAVPQGMTGWWQINGRADKPMHLHTEDDIYYIQNYSLWMDVYILLKTPWVVVRGKGAY